MNKAAFDEMVGLVDEAIDLADDAVKAAEDRGAQTEEPVTLVKVAHSRFQEAAVELLKTGAFNGHTVESLTNTLEKAGSAEFLELMEKLASRAVFSIDAETALGGDLVERSMTTPKADSRKPGESDTDLWGRCCSDAGLNV